MSTVLKVVGFAGGQPCSITGQYLKTFDHEASDGLGYGTFTLDVSEAMKFDNMAHAFEFYRKVSRCMPLRPDGKPNRPLTCTTWDFIDLDRADGSQSQDQRTAQVIVEILSEKR